MFSDSNYNRYFELLKEAFACLQKENVYNLVEGYKKKKNKYIDKVVCASKSFEYSPLKCND